MTDWPRRSRFGWPWGTTALVCLMFYGFQREIDAINWHIIETIIDDLAFSWVAFAAHPFENVPRLMSHTFLHANQSHIMGNVLFFLLFAPAVERAVGHLLFVALYLAWGAAAACTQGFFDPFQAGAIGASGAISGAAGAYFVLFPLRTPRSFLTQFLGRIVSQIPAFFWIGLWFLSQLKGGFQAILPQIVPGQVTNIGYWAHIGGFAAGALSAAPFVWLRDPADQEASLPK